MPANYPRLRSIGLDTTDARRLAEFYRALLGFEYRPGDEPPGAGQPDPKGADWVVLIAPATGVRLAFQQVADLPPSTWPTHEVPQQLHFDFMVSNKGELRSQHERALSLGARLLDDRFEDPIEPLYVYADPDGHPFCIFVAPS